MNLNTKTQTTIIQTTDRRDAVVSDITDINRFQQTNNTIPESLSNPLGPLFRNAEDSTLINRARWDEGMSRINIIFEQTEKTEQKITTVFKNKPTMSTTGLNQVIINENYFNKKNNQELENVTQEVQRSGDNEITTIQNNFIESTDNAQLSDLINNGFAFFQNPFVGGFVLGVVVTIGGFAFRNALHRRTRTNSANTTLSKPSTSDISKS